MSDSRRVDSLDEFPSESLDLYTSAPGEAFEEPAGLLAIVPAPPVVEAAPADSRTRAWQRRRRVTGAPRRHAKRAFAAIAQMTWRAARDVRASMPGSSTRVSRDITSQQLRTHEAEGFSKDVRTDGVRPRNVAEPAPGASLLLARQRRRERLRRSITEAAGRDSLVRVATVSQLTPVVARVAAASSARARRRLHAALTRLAMYAHALVVHARMTAVNVWNVTAPAVSSFARHVVWPFSTRVALRLRSALEWLGENGLQLIGQMRSALRRGVASLGENVPRLIGQTAVALRVAGRLLHPRSVAVAVAMLALIVIASPKNGSSDMSGAVPPAAPVTVATAPAEPATSAPKMVDVNTAREERPATMPPLIVATATVVEPSVVKPAVAPAAVAIPRPPARIDPRAIQAVLNRYRDALSTLDVSAVRSVWPNADVSALQEEFAGVQDQNVEFEACRISGAGSGALASCAGVIESGFKPGDRRPRMERRRWQFTLVKSGASWKIVEVQMQRG